jgi:replicative superfamily II helicase
LIFCNTRKATQQAAKQLADECKKLRRSFGNMFNGQRQKLATLSSRIKDKGLQELVVEGIGFHHA